MAHGIRVIPTPASPAPAPADQSRPYRLGWRLVVGIVAASAVVAFAVVGTLAVGAGMVTPVLPFTVAPMALIVVDAAAAVQLVIAGGAEFGRWFARRSS